MRLIRSKKLKQIEQGDTYIYKKVSEAEFLLYAKKEIVLLFAEGVTQKNHEKFADLIEVLHSTCNMLKMDWYECSKIKSTKRWSDGEYEFGIAKKIDSYDQEG